MSHDSNIETGSQGKGSWTALDWLFHSPLALPLVGLIVVSVLMAFASDNFFTLNNILNVLRQVSVVGILEITRASQAQAATTFRPLEVYLAAACIYLAINLCLAVLGRWLEHRTAV